MFIRTVWGDISKNGIRNGKMASDIKRIKDNPYNSPFVVYVFGQDNYNELVQQGFQCKLIDKNPLRYDPITQLYRHKLDVFFEALKDYKEIVFLDWDCRPTKYLPLEFWDIMGKKAPFQANLFLYRTKKCLWRQSDWRKVCNGGFVYIRDLKIAAQIIQNYEDLKKWVLEQKMAREKMGKKLRFREEALMFDDEPAMSKWVDDYSKGWPGVEQYWNIFEPNFCNLGKKSAFMNHLLSLKDECFVHWG